MNPKHESNRKAWNEASTYYKKGLEESIELLKKGDVHLCPPELRILSPIKDKINLAIHLQCAAGTDSLSLLNFGAKKVVGIDISEDMLELARLKTERLNMNAEWIQSDILEIPTSLNSSADFVYTGRGAINWISNIDAWAQVVARLLKPGGYFYLFEGHPFTYCFDMNAPVLTFASDWKGYFSEDSYESKDWPESYVGKLKANSHEQAIKYERPWPVSRIIGALLKTGLILECFEEHPDKYWEEFTKLPDQIREMFPNTFSVLARKP
jgi:ubiquinone/menaquinone biosynthesis C-methylase UbiE